MSNARNLGNVGSRLQQTESVGLSAGGNIKAITFQGSGRLLTDILTLTGGQINIPVGSTRQFKNLQSALNSLTSYIFEDTANVQILLDDETFNETDTINLSLDYGDRVTIKGQGDYNFKSTIGSPVFSVSGVNTSTLSATILLNASSDVPAVGDYVNIYSVSGRDASFLAGLAVIDLSNTNGLYVFGAELLGINPVGKQRTGSGSRIIQVGDVAVVTLLSGGNATTTTITRAYTVSSVAIKDYNGFNRSEIRFSNTTPIPSANVDNCLVQIGTPNSYIGNTFTQVSAAGMHVTFPTIAGNYVLTFSDLTPTQNYLNPGDQILALGQARVVEAVSSNNKCFLDAPFRTGRRGLSGFNQSDSYSITTPTSYLVKTFYERYRGCHRVAAVNGTTSITIEVPDYAFFLPSMKGSTTARQPISGFPLPRYGITSIGNGFNTIDPFVNGKIFESYPQSKIFKTKLNFSNITSSSFFPALTSDIGTLGFTCLYINNSKLRMLDNLVILNNGLTKQNGLRAGFGLPSETPTQSTLTLGASGIGIVGSFAQHVLVGNNSNVNINNLGIGVYIRNYTQIVREGNLDINLLGEYSNIYYNQGCGGTINFLTSVGPTNQIYVPLGTTSNYTAINANGKNFFTSNNETGICFNVLLHKRSDGYAEIDNAVAGGLIINGMTLFNSNGTTAHRHTAIGNTCTIVYGNIIGAGTYTSSIGNFVYCYYNVHNAIIGALITGSTSFTQIINSYFCINSIVSGLITFAGLAPAQYSSHFYFCDGPIGLQLPNMSIDFSQNTIFSNCTTVFIFSTIDTRAIALNCVARNCNNIVVGFASSNYIDVVTGNSFSPPTIQNF
jgi:hypothetical protein